MPQRPRTIPSTSIDESKLREINYKTNFPSKPDIPHLIVRALVQGLLHHVLVPARHRAMEKFSFDVIAEALLAHAERSTTANSEQIASGYTSEQVIPLARTVEKFIKSLLHHPNKDVLSAQSNILLPELSEYDSPECKGSKVKKLRWLQDHLPAILKKLKREHRCPYMECPAGQTMPDKAELKKWVGKANGAGELRLHILAHYHGSTYSGVKDRLHRQSPHFKLRANR